MEGAHRRRRPLLLYVILLTSIFSLISTEDATSQDELRLWKNYDRYRYLPRLPKLNESPQPLPDATRDVTGDDQVVVQELLGLIFLDNDENVVENAGDQSGVAISFDKPSRVANTKEFRKIAESYLGSPVSQLRLNELIRDLILLYRKYDRPVVDISVPVQDVTEGTIQILVREGKIGRACVQGACYFDNQMLANQLFLRRGQSISEKRLNDEVRWLYRNPFRTIDLELTPGENAGETDVIFNVHDERPVRIYSGYEDTGNQALGLERTFYGINWYNAFCKDDYIGYQYTASSDFESLEAHSAFYSKALHNRDILSTYASYAEFESPLAGINNRGRTWQILNRWYRELVVTDTCEKSITAGFDIKETNNNLDQGGISVFNSNAQVLQFMFGYVERRECNNGRFAYGIDGFFSPGNWLPENDDAAFQEVRAFATANYAYARAWSERIIELPWCFELTARLTGQLSEANLLPTEQLGLGGYNSIRGYDLFSVVGDSGYFANIELWSPSMCLWGGQLRSLAFLDAGQAFNHTLLPDEASSINMQGTGLGFRYDIDPTFSVRCDYAWQLSRLPAVYQQPPSRIHLGVLISY